MFDSCLLMSDGSKDGTLGARFLPIPPYMDARHVNFEV